MIRFRWGLVAASAIGLGAGLWAFGRAGLGQTLTLVGTIGWRGVAQLFVANLAILGMLGAAWGASMRPGVPRPLIAFAWARTVREAANDLLPFSQLGGLLIGIRILLRSGLPAERVHAATLVDLTTEMISQLLLTLFGLWVCLSVARAGGGLGGMGLAGVGIMAAITAGFILFQRPMLTLAARLAERVAPATGAALTAALEELRRFGRKRGAMIPSFACNLAAWMLSVAWAWLGLRLLGDELPFARVVAMEALIFALRTSAFLIPGALGIQEAGYVALAELFGLSREAALALSIAKRARDFGFGIPALLIWQVTELRGPGRPQTPDA